MGTSWRKAGGSLADDGRSQELAAGDSYIALILTDQESSEVSRVRRGFPAIVATAARAVRISDRASDHSWSFPQTRLEWYWRTFAKELQ
jgi:hypothetical protein